MNLLKTEGACFKRIYVIYQSYESVLLFGKRTTANLYSHLEYNAKVSSAETIARVLGGKSDDKPEAEQPAEKKKTTSRKSTAKAASKTPKKSGSRKKKSDNPEGTGESQVSTL